MGSEMCIRDRSAAVLLETKSSTEKQSSAIIVHKSKRTATSTRTIHTRQNKPYRLGAVRAGVVGARGRYCPAATVPVAVVLPCGVCCCIAENKQNKYHQSKNRALPYLLMNIQYIYVHSGVQREYILLERSEFLIPTWVTPLSIGLHQKKKNCDGCGDYYR